MCIILSAMGTQLQIGLFLTVEGGADMSRVKLLGMVTESSKEEVSVRFTNVSGLAAAITPGMVVDLAFGDSTGLHRARATVLRTSAGPAAGLVLRPPQEFLTTQRRNFFRVYTRLPAPYTITRAADEATVGQEDREAFTQDISAGGTLLWTVRQLAVGDGIQLRIVCPCEDEPAPGRGGTAPSAGRLVLLNGQVLRVERIPATRKECYSAGVRFVDLSVSEQDRMVGLMFDLQRRLMSR
jgi:hypothetical protein